MTLSKNRMPAHDYLENLERTKRALQIVMDEKPDFIAKEFWRAFAEKEKAVLKAVNALSLKSCWHDAQTFTQNDHHGCAAELHDGQAWLANAIAAAYPTFENITSIGDSQSWQADVLKQTEKLKRLIRAMPANYLGSSQNYLRGVLTGKKIHSLASRTYLYDGLVALGLDIDAKENSDIHRLVDWFLVLAISELKLDSPIAALERIERTYSFDLPNDSHWPNRRTGSEGRRSYFVRALTRGMIGRTGEAKRAMVASITNEIFDDSKIGEQQIAFLTNDIVKAPLGYVDETELFFMRQCLLLASELAGNIGVTS